MLNFLFRQLTSLAGGVLLLCAGCAHAQPAPQAVAPRTDFVFGTLQSTLERAPQMRAAGVRLAVVGVAWGRYQPRAGEFDAAYIAEVKSKIAAFGAAGQQVALDLGMQYPPSWIFELPHSRYKNQFGDEWRETASGQSTPNAVWNERVRQAQAAYVARVFSDLGTAFHHVRLGWGWYGELHFPKAKYADKANCYWAFDDIAQGKAPGLAAGLKPCPVPNWKPGEPSVLHRNAALFADWYTGALQNYHDWQIALVRKHFAGKMAMLYPSWGIRPGQLDAAIAVDLNGSTPAERNGEVPAALDFARLVAGLKDADVFVYTTWLDAPFGDDATRDPVQWTPGHYLAYLAAAHPLNLQTMGENTGRADAKALERSARRMRDYNLQGLVWAFEPQLFDEKFIGLEPFAQTIEKVRRGEISLRLPPRPDALHARVRGELKGFTDWLAAGNAQGFIGEVGWPDNTGNEADEWNALADVWYRDANAANLWVTSWATGEWWGTGYKLAPYEDRRAPGGVDTPDTQAEIVEAHGSTPAYARGVNVAGAEFGEGADFSNQNPGAHDQKYHYDGAATFQFLSGRGIKLIRLPFRWERIQRIPGGDLDAEELRRLKEAVSLARRAGLQVVLDLHNYARYRLAQNGKVETKILGAPDFPAAHLADLWRRLSLEFKADEGVFYGLMNEPHDIPDAGGKRGAQIWEEISQTVLDAIRKNGDTKLVMVPGYGWSGVRSWRENHPRGWVQDPANNFRYEAHHYWDATAGGQYEKPYAAALEAATQAGFKP